MKDHVKTSVEIGITGLSVEAVITELREKSKGIVNPVLERDYWGDFCIEGLRPMTDREKQTAERRRAASKAAAEARKNKKEQSERKQYEALKAKYG